MAIHKTQFAIDQEEKIIRRNANPNARLIQQPLRYAYFSYTKGSETVADDDEFLLGSLQTEGAVIIPELSRVYNTGAGDADLDLKLRKYGTTTDLTGLASLDNNAAAFTRPASVDVPELSAGDYISAFVDNFEALASGEVLHFEIAYRTAKSAH